ncbi:MAG: aminotransferase class III-fold pyridoxal phosphate-dependent enzyme [Actinobacteria bacterium]|nr:aminotransferase class III-fold pyridoxal phosphate-dependent enzyme [Actinomycetota bacterium]
MATPTSNRADQSSLVERAAGVLPSGIAHDVRFRQPRGPYFTGGAGARKIDVEGNEYIDFLQGHGSLIRGIAPPEVTSAIVEAAGTGTHLGGNHPREVRWAEQIAEMVPCADRVRFTASGTEATLLALRLARTATGREIVLKLDGHFHGWHDYVVKGLEEPYEEPLSPGIPAGTLASVEVVAPRQAAERIARGDVAALILEPNGAVWGTARLEPEWIAEMRAACERHGTVCIFDEVITGFRAAPGGMQERLGIVPDLCTLAKVAAGGMPGGAVGGRAELMEPLEMRVGDPEWNRWKHVHHPGTYNANPVSAAAGVAMLDLLRDGSAIREAEEKAEMLRGLLRERLGRGAIPVAVWGESSWFHVAPGLAEQPDDVMAFKRIDPRLRDGLDRGLLARGVDAMTLGGFVGTAHTEEDLNQAAEAYAAAMEEVEATIEEVS